jgi:hypothetical protein
MTELLAIFFLIGIAVFLLVILFIFKNKAIALLCGLCWSILAIYNMQRSILDPEAGQMVWAFGWICIVATMICWTSPFWMTGMKKEKVVSEPVEEEDYYEKIQRNTDRIRKRRPRRSSPWNQ